MADVKLFLSCVSDEFGDYRDELRNALTRPNVEIKIQEDFQAMGGDTLALLETYVESCDVVVHFIGDMAGSTPKPSSVDDLLKRRSELAARLAEKGMDRGALGRLTYTQWEAWLAIGFNRDGAKQNLVIVTPTYGLKHGAKFAPTDATRASQADHLRWLRAINFYPAKPFTSADNLVARIFGSAVLDALKKADTRSITKPRNLPFASLGSLFAGRDEDLAGLHTALLGAKGAPVALHGLGGVGKTRLAIEYAWSREAIYSALLFVSASDGTALNAGLAGLTAFEILDLPEKEARDDATKITAVLRWLESNPTWHMILDNVDDRAAVGEVAKLMPRLKGGHVVVTARASNFPAGVRKLEVSTLDENAATQFLLDRTDADRTKTKDDAALARTLARELGGLALGLEQAGAHIATDRIGFARYLKLWTESREKALAWADATVTGSDRTLATTWATSVARLSPESRRLLERLAFLAPDPVPDLLLDVAVPGEASDTDAYASRAGLYAYSLISAVTVEDGGAPAFVVHRLVQNFARRAMSDERRAQALREALEWMDTAFVGDPQDVRNWPVLDPLAPHALAVARAADGEEIAEPTSRLFNQIGLLLKGRADFAQAEPLMRRALAIDESSYGPDHPNVAIRLNNLGALLQATNRLAEAEPLMRRALAIDETNYGPDHPNVAIHLNNLAALLQATNRLAEAELLMRTALVICEKSLGHGHPFVANCLDNLAQLLKASDRLAEAEPLMRRALAIDESSYGPDHPNVAIRLNNLGALLQATNRLAEAEPLTRRALAIDEKNYGLDHPNVAMRLNNLAFLFEATDRLPEAEPLRRRALAIFEANLGPDHPYVTIGLDNLAQLLKASGRLAEAEPLMRRALAIDESSYGPDHPNVAIRLNNLGALLQATNRLAEAEPLMRRALAIDETSYGPDHPNVAIRLNNLAQLLGATNRLTEAEPLMRRALSIFETSLGPDHPNTVRARNNLAGLEAALANGDG
jgi:tetratricopeptide (TPR) repeat protein